MAFQNRLSKCINLYFFRKPEKILGFTSKFKQGRVTLNTGIVLFGLTMEFSSHFYTMNGPLHNAQ